MKSAEDIADLIGFSKAEKTFNLQVVNIDKVQTNSKEKFQFSSTQ